MPAPRLFISTDMQMMSGVNHTAGDKDDVQSLIHALMYQDKLNIVGIASSTSHHQPGANSESFIHKVIDQYATDYSKLAARNSDFKTAAELREITYQGTKSLAPSSGLVSANEASRAIIQEAREAAAAGEPLYVAAWGGLGDVARALHDAPDIADNIRLMSASGIKQEPNAYGYIKDKLAGEGDLWWIDALTTQVGIYASPAGKTANLNNDWAVENAKGHGSLGELFYQNTIDVKGTLDDFNAVKMGDSYTVFYLIDQASNNDPTATSWGGQYRKSDTDYWVDRTDIRWSWDGSNGAPTTYEHRAAWQADFEARLDWLKATTSTPTQVAKPSPTTVAPEPAPTAGKTLTGTSSNNTLNGGAGNDLIDGREGADTMTGGAGNDVYYVDHSSDRVVEAEGGGTDTVHSKVSWTLGANLENLMLRTDAAINGVGNGLANSITGNSGANQIDGAGGADKLDGRGGNDRLIGGAGNDTLTGGAGDDLFIFAVGSGHNVITDFIAGGREDRIQLKGYKTYDATQKGSDTLVEFGQESVLLRNVQVSSLTSSDFAFA